MSGSLLVLCERRSVLSTKRKAGVDNYRSALYVQHIFLQRVAISDRTEPQRFPQIIDVDSYNCRQSSRMSVLLDVEVQFTVGRI
jgi:hypothetical protein